MKKYKIVFIDLDGTLVPFGTHKVKKETIDVLKALQEKGVYIIICTGRALERATDIHKQIDFGKANYIISGSGEQIYDVYKKEFILKRNISKKSMLALVDFSIQKRLAIHQLSERDTIYFAKGFNAKELLSISWTKNRFDKKIDLQNFDRSKKEYGKINIFVEKNLKNVFQFEKEIQTKFPNLKTAIVNYEYYIIEVSATSKADSIKDLLSILNIDKEESVGVGDTLNDREMLNLTGYSICMKEAPKDLKNIVDEVTLSSEKNGVGISLKKLILS